MAMKNNAKFEEELTCHFKIDMRNLMNFDLSIWKSKIFILMCSFWAKHSYIVWAKKSTEELSFMKLRSSYANFEEKLTSGLKKDEKFGKFSPEHLKVSKLKLWWDPFVQSRKGMTLKFTEELCVMTMKNNAKFEEELTCHFKTDIRNLTNFDSSTRKSEKIPL